jgi:UDP-N-acetylglucosamine 4,6-dehydratase
MNYTTNRLNETGKTVAMGAEYNSGSNPHFLTVQEIREYNRVAGA